MRSATGDDKKFSDFFVGLPPVPQEVLVGGVARHILVAVANFAQSLHEGAALLLRHLEAAEDLPVVGAVFALVEERDVPAPGDYRKEVI